MSAHSLTKMHIAVSKSMFDQTESEFVFDFASHLFACLNQMDIKSWRAEIEFSFEAYPPTICHDGQSY